MSIILLFERDGVALKHQPVVIRALTIYPLLSCDCVLLSMLRFEKIHRFFHPRLLLLDLLILFRDQSHYFLLLLLLAFNYCLAWLAFAVLEILTKSIDSVTELFFHWNWLCKPLALQFGFLHRWSQLRLVRKYHVCYLNALLKTHLPWDVPFFEDHLETQSVVLQCSVHCHELVVQYSLI